MGCPGAPRTERPLAGGRLAVWDGGGIRAGQLPWLQGEVKSKQVFLPSPFHSKDRGAGGLGACSRVCVLAGARVTQGLFFWIYLKVWTKKHQPGSPFLTPQGPRSYRTSSRWSVQGVVVKQP